MTNGMSTAMNKDNVNLGLINHGLLTRGELPKNTGNLTLKWYPLCSFRVNTVSPIIGNPPPARWGMLTITDQFLQWYETNNLPAGIHILHFVYCSKQIFVDHIRYYMCHGHNMGCFIHLGMVMNPLIGIYISTKRIPNMGWMTISHIYHVLITAHILDICNHPKVIR